MIVMYDLEGNYICEFKNYLECAKYFNTNKGTIHRVLSGKRNKYKDFKFIYV